MKRPESPNSLCTSLLAKLMNCEFLKAVRLWKLREGEKTDQVMSFHDVVELNPPTLGGPFQLRKRHARIVHCQYGQQPGGCRNPF